MKIAVNRKHFLGLVDRVASAAASGRVNNEVLKFVRVDATERLTVQATDGEVSIVVDGDAEIERAGSALIDPVKFVALVKESTAEIVTIEATESGINVAAGKSRFSLPAVSADQFPRCKRIEGDWITTQAEQLIGAINRTKFACDTDSTRYQLGGVLVETGEQLTLVATDGRRLSKICIDATNGKSGHTAIVPHKGLAAIVKAISGASDVNVHISKNSICVATEAAYVESRLIEGRFPAYGRIIPAMESMKFIPIEAGPFVSAMRQALVVANAEHRAVTLAFSPGELGISAKASDVGVVDTSMPVDTSETITTIIDGRFVADFAERCGSDEVFELRLKSESEPAVFIAGQWTYVVMPMARS